MVFQFDDLDEPLVGGGAGADEPLILEALSLCLETSGYDVLEAQDGSSGLATLEREARVDVLITDVALPGASGVELARQAKRRRPGLGLLYISAYPKASLIESYGLDPEATVLQKPFSKDRLLDAIEHLLE